MLMVEKGGMGGCGGSKYGAGIIGRVDEYNING